jgi:hypothetical protein
MNVGWQRAKNGLRGTGVRLPTCAVVRSGSRERRGRSVGNVFHQDFCWDDLNAAIASVRNQTRPAREIILVVDNEALIEGAGVRSRVSSSHLCAAVASRVPDWRPHRSWRFSITMRWPVSAGWKKAESNAWKPGFSKTKTIAPFIEEFGQTLAAQVGRICRCVS